MLMSVLRLIQTVCFRCLWFTTGHIRREKGLKKVLYEIPVYFSYNVRKLSPSFLRHSAVCLRLALCGFGNWYFQEKAYWKLHIFMSVVFGDK